ncbi:MAG: hemerythrin domain-containing protein [Rubrivivax sp.]|nr:hemerythrin domain-containing protein [Rubrivivax sp.]
MRTAALDVIRDEHQALAAMLRSMKMLLEQARREQVLPDFGVLRAMLFYVDEFPERLHHTKETELLFPRLRERAPELATTIARLNNDHLRGESAIREVEHALLAFEVMGESRRLPFEQAVGRYVTAYLEHMAVEEADILPAAQRAFTPADWSELDAAFAANRDPLTGHEPADDYRELFHTIVNNAPAPIGLGSARR